MPERLRQASASGCRRLPVRPAQALQVSSSPWSPSGFRLRRVLHSALGLQVLPRSGFALSSPRPSPGHRPVRAQAVRRSSSDARPVRLRRLCPFRFSGCFCPDPGLSSGLRPSSSSGASFPGPVLYQAFAHVARPVVVAGPSSPFVVVVGLCHQGAVIVRDRQDSSDAAQLARQPCQLCHSDLPFSVFKLRQTNSTSQALPTDNLPSS